MKKTIVIFSNPFGYGPTGKAIAIGKEFLRRGYLEVIFAGSSFVKEIIPSSFSFVEIDERNEQAIQDWLKTISNPYVISSQNRFAIKAARALNVPCAFIDGLSWFWKEIPNDHFIADEIFWMNYPGIEKKLSKSAHFINLVPAIIDIQSATPIRNQVLIHLGGCKNPMVNTFPKNYLDILSDGLSKVSSQYKIMVTGGVEAMNYLGSRLLPNTKKRVTPVSLKHDEFIKELDRSVHFVTTAGQTATLEALALGIPTSFLLPMNLSQLALTSFLSLNKASTHYLKWDDYISKITDSASLNERDALTLFNNYAKTITTQEKIRGKLIQDIAQLISKIPEIDDQKKFIYNLGINGAEMIGQVLFKKWKLTQKNEL